MSSTDQAEAAAAFRDMHSDGILVLPCAWNCASARLFEEAGFHAVGTTSSGIAHSLGLPDGEHADVERVISMVERIVDCTSVPISTDFEAGYGATHEAVLDHIEAVIEAGAIGINIEDGTGHRADPLVDKADQASLIESIQELGDVMEVPLVINARTDVYLDETDPSNRFEKAVTRANEYLDAGADCAFVIGVTDGPLIGKLADAIDGPINVLATRAEMPPIERLERLGVARISVGGGPMHASMGHLQRIASELRTEGTFTYLEKAIPHPEMQRMFSKID